MKDMLRNTLLISFFIMAALSIKAQQYNWIWAHELQVPGNNPAYKIAADRAGNHYIAGVFSNESMEFGPYFIHNAGVMAGTYDVFLAKYDADGNVLWARSMGGTLYETVTGIAVDKDDNVYLCGDFSSGRPGFDTVYLHNIDTFTYSLESYLVKYNSAGSVLWAKEISGTANEQASGLDVDMNGNISVSGNSNSSVIYIDSNTYARAGSAVIFICSYDSIGHLRWSNVSNGAGTSFARAICTDESHHTYILGSSDFLHFDTTTYFASISSQSFILTMDDSGKIVLHKEFSGILDAAAIKSDHRAALYVAGQFSSDTLVFDSVSLTSNQGANDVFLMKVDTASNGLWLRSFGGAAYEGAADLSIDKDGSIMLVGSYQSLNIPLLFDTLINYGINNSFITQYNSSGDMIWLNSLGSDGFNGIYGIAVDSDANYYMCGAMATNGIIFPHDSLANSDPSQATNDMFMLKLGKTCDIIKRQPLSTTVTVNLNADFIVDLGADTAVFQWQLDRGTGFSNLSEASPYSGTQTRHLHITNCSHDFNTYRYRCVITGGSCTLATEPATLLVAWRTGIEQTTNEIAWSLYPNPTTGNAYFTADKPLDELWVKDMQGRVILHQNAPFNSFNLSSEASGMYMVQVRQGMEFSHKKLIIQH
jgi:hypothetical protein